MKILAACLIFLFIAQPLYARQENGNTEYRKALQFVKDEQDDFALMGFRAIIRNFPESAYAQESLFAIGEYFYSRKIYYEAAKNFTEYIKKYPESDGAVFARAYLLRIVQSEQRREEEKKALEEIEREFFSQPLFLLFSEYKEVSYKSAFQNVFTIRHYIDAIEVYKNGTLFLKLAQ